MGRIVSDIEHYFRKHDVDIMSATAKRDLIADNLVPLLNSLSIRENYLVDMVYELLVNEAYVQVLQDQLCFRRARNNTPPATVAGGSVSQEVPHE